MELLMHIQQATCLTPLVTTISYKFVILTTLPVNHRYVTTRYNFNLPHPLSKILLQLILRENYAYVYSSHNIIHWLNILWSNKYFCCNNVKVCLTVIIIYKQPFIWSVTLNIFLFSFVIITHSFIIYCFFNL